jgi:Mg2+/Co2+ transporter CorB
MDTSFTIQTLLSFTGAVIATALLPNVIATFTELSPKTLRAIALVMAMGLAFLSAFLVKESEWTKWVVAFFNGLMIYLSALGANETLSRGLKRGVTTPPPTLAGKSAEAGPEKKKFFGSWF